MKEYVLNNREDIWQALACNPAGNLVDIKEKDSRIISTLGDVKNLNVHSLNKVVSWATQKSIGIF